MKNDDKYEQNSKLMIGNQLKYTTWVLGSRMFYLRICNHKKMWKDENSRSDY